MEHYTLVARRDGTTRYRSFRVAGPLAVWADGDPDTVALVLFRMLLAHPPDDFWDTADVTLRNAAGIPLDRRQAAASTMAT